MSSLDLTVRQWRDQANMLRQRWEETKPLWNDAVRWSFEKKYWTPLQQQTELTAKEMERVAQVIAKARRSVK